MKMNKTKLSPRKSGTAIAALLLAIVGLARTHAVAAEACAMGIGTCDAEVEEQPQQDSAKNANGDYANNKDAASNSSPQDDYYAHCYNWPPEGVPPEHRDTACDREWQNRVWAADDAEANAAPPEDLIADTVYLNMPEEKTWVCPLDTVDAQGAAAKRGGVTNLFNLGGGMDGKKSNHYSGTTGHPTRWIIHNEASNPILLTHVNALGLEVSAHDFQTHPAHSSTTVYPRGPVVLPGQMAVVDGLQGQMFIAREYKEILPIDAAMRAMDAEEEDIDPSWKSFKSVLPSTLSFLPHESRYFDNKGVWHVLGQPGRVLIKHRMGNIYVRNKSGAICPELLGEANPEANVDDGRRGNAKDMTPECNVLRKAFINKVGCPIDIYFAPQNKIEGYNCEKFTKHLGPLDTFLASDPTTRDIDGHNSPLKFENTYNGHNFVARMTHDGTFVAKIEVDHDVVKDCPEPTRRGAVGVEVPVDERMLSGVPLHAMAVNATANVAYASDVVNASSVRPVLTTKRHRQRAKEDLLWQNRTRILSSAMPIAS